MASKKDTKTEPKKFLGARTFGDRWVGKRCILIKYCKNEFRGEMICDDGYRIQSKTIDLSFGAKVYTCVTNIPELKANYRGNIFYCCCFFK